MKLFTLLKIFILLAIAIPAESVPYNEKRAFCRQKLSYPCEIYGISQRCPVYGEYETTKRFNECIKDADRLIRKDEQEDRQRQLEWEKGAPERERMKREKKRQEAIRESARQKKIQQQVDNMDDMFR